MTPDSSSRLPRDESTRGISFCWLAALAAVLFAALAAIPGPNLQAAEPLNPVKAALAADRAVVGFIVGLPSAPVAQLLARSGPDWLWIDMEHGPLDLPTVQTMIAVTQGTGVAPLVRVAKIDPVPVKQALDAGAFGIIFPMAQTAADAALAVASARYPPAGVRGVGPTLAAARWGLPVMEYIRRANDEILIVLLIERVEAVRNLDAILKVPGLDVAFIAPFDLSASLGLPGQVTHEKVTATIAGVEAKILASDVALGGLAFNPEVVNAMISRGYRFVMVGSDSGLLSRGARDMLGKLRR